MQILFVSTTKLLQIQNVSESTKIVASTFLKSPLIMQGYLFFFK